MLFIIFLIYQVRVLLLVRMMLLITGDVGF